MRILIAEDDQVLADGLLRSLRASGAAVDHVASGSEATPDGLRNEDALALQAASEPRPDYALVNPWALRQPTAPEIAARLDGVEVTMAPILAVCVPARPGPSVPRP